MARTIRPTAGLQRLFPKAKDETRWIAYIDLDEFICLRREQNIRNWIQKYDKYPTVYVNWKQFGTSGRLQHDDSQLVIEQYTACWPHPANSGKSFVNTSYTFHRFECHMFYPDVRFLGIKTTILPVNEFKKFIHYWIMRSPRKGESEIQINHYYNRSYAQYLYKTLHRGDACSADSQKEERSKVSLNGPKPSTHQGTTPYNASSCC